MKNYRKFLAIVAFTFLIFGNSPSHAETQEPRDVFKSSEFLTWEEDGQAFYIESSLGMASLVAAQNNKAQAKCIDDWYYEYEKASITFVLDTMKRFPDYHPRGVILAVIEKKCGKLIYN